MRDAVRLTSLDRLLGGAERAIALIDRCRPRNAASEIERVIEAWENGQVAVPEHRYAPPPDLTEVQRALEAVATVGAHAGPWGELYAARAAELCREARIVEALGTGALRDRALARFRFEADRDGRRAASTARRWASLAVRAEEPTVLSDDERHPDSLVSIVRALVGSMRLPIRISVTPDLACAAAAGDGFVVVRRGIRHRPASARRIALHEVLGHALPRLRAHAEACGLFSVGTARGAEDEEGRALLIEERHLLLDDERRRELGVRHLAAVAVRAGADWVETVRSSMGYGLSARDAVRIASRVHRGGGLAREIIYLPARARVGAAFERDPSLESWLERGRIGVDAGRAMRELGAPPPELDLAAVFAHRNVAMTGA